MIRSRFKHFMQERVEYSTTGEETLLSVSEYYGVKTRIHFFGKGVAESPVDSLKGYRKVYGGDLVMNYMLAWKGAYGVSEYNGIVSPAYAVYRINPQYADRRFIHHKLRSKCMHAVFKSHSKGIIDSRLRLYPDVFLSIAITLPDLSTQKGIADFLDHKTALIDQLIEKKQKLIMLLEEYKQVIIHQAVTGQIDVRTGQPYLAYKPSGVEWLEEIPENWKMVKLKFLAKIRNSNVDKTISDDEELILLCNYTNVYYNDCITPSLNFMQGSAKMEEITRFQLKKDQVLITKDSESWDDIGIPALVTEDMPKVLCGYHLAIFEPLNQLDGGFLAWLCRSKPLNDQFKLAAKGVTRFGISQSAMKNPLIVLPPTLTQRRIARFLDDIIADINKVTDNIKNQIELLQEYRTRLIADAVTSKIDVREAAAELQQTNSATCGDETNSTLSNSITEYQI